MNREIKFRGQRVDTKEWVYGYYFKTPLTYEGSEIAAKDGWNFMSDGKVRHCISDRGITYEVISETVGQFTGQRDWGNKEIYDNDVCSDGEYTFLVEWNKRGGWYWKQLSKNEEDESGMFTSHDIAGSLGIIGNIHDNPVKEGI